MHRFLPVIAAALVLFPTSRLTTAQLLNKEAPVIVGHYHLNVTSVAEHKKFWVDTLGGTAIKFGPDKIDVIKFPGILLFLRVQPPTGRPVARRSTTSASRCRTFPQRGQGSRQRVRVDGRSGARTRADRRPRQRPAITDRFAYLVGPDGVKVELVTAEKNAPPIAHHHVHFVNKQYVEMQQWYMKAFNATLRPGQTDFFIGADLPGVGYMLNFFRWEPNENSTGTTGRAVDHIGFEVKNLQAFCKQLEAKGIKLTAPYRKAPEMNNIATAMITDPWGTSIELTEGLDQVR